VTQPPDPEPRPRPQYGEYAPPGWVSPNPDAAPPPPAPAVIPALPRPPRAWDRPLTLGLLVLGFFGMLFGVYGGTNLQLVLEQAGAIQGLTVDLPAWTGTAGWLIVVSHVLLYAIAVTVGVNLLRRGRLAFWVPLAAGVVAAIVYNGLVGALGVAAGLLPTLG
jgi:hypothetical protein